MLNKRNQHKAIRKYINYRKKKFTNSDTICLIMLLEMLMLYNKGGK